MDGPLWTCVPAPSGKFASYMACAGFPEAGVPSEMRTPMRVIYQEVFPEKIGGEV